MTKRALRVASGDVQRLAYDHVAKLVFGVPLAVTEDRARQVLQAVGLRLVTGEDAAVELAGDVFGGRACPAADEVPVTADGVAVVHLGGTFTPKRGGMDALSGLLSYEEASALLEAVAAKPNVRGLVLAIDSPGGSVMGCQEAADVVAAITKKKPVYAVADHVAASAAYWLASQADRIFVSSLGVVGSVGVIAIRLDATAADKEAGLAYTFVTSGERKADGYPHKALSKGERDALQERVDQAAALMFAAIAKGRRMQPDAVAALEAGIFAGEAGVTAGLADQVGTVADAVAAMTKKLNGPRASLGGTAAEGRTDMSDTTQPPVAAEAQPDKVTAITPEVQKQLDAARKEGETAALARAKDIRDVCALFGKAGLQITGEQIDGFIASGIDEKALRGTLQEQLVAADEAQKVAGQVKPPAPNAQPAVMGTAEAFQRWRDGNRAA